MREVNMDFINTQDVSILHVHVIEQRRQQQAEARQKLCDEIRDFSDDEEFNRVHLQCAVRVAEPKRKRRTPTKMRKLSTVPVVEEIAGETTVDQ